MWSNREKNIYKEKAEKFFCVFLIKASLNNNIKSNKNIQFEPQ